MEYYSEADLTIGTVLNVWGRKLLLCDCDGYTREFYRTKYGIGEGRGPWRESDISHIRT